MTAYRCANVHMEVENIDIFVSGPLQYIGSIVSRFLRKQSRNLLTIDHVVSYAREEGESYRPRMRTIAELLGSTIR